MKTAFIKVIIPCLTTLFTTFALASEPVIEEKQFELNGTRELKLEFEHMDVHLADRSDNTLTLTLTQEVKRGDHDKCLYRITSSKDKQSLAIKTQKVAKMNSDSCRVKRTLNITLDSQALEKLSIDIRHGKTKISALHTQRIELVFAHTPHSLEQLSSQYLSISSAHGNGTFGTIQCGEMSADIEHGDSSFQQVNVTRYSGKWSHGDMFASTIKAEQLSVASSHGKITIHEFAGNNVKLSSKHGGIVVNNSHSDNLQLEVSHANAKFNGSTVLPRQQQRIHCSLEKMI